SVIYPLSLHDALPICSAFSHTALGSNASSGVGAGSLKFTTALERLIPSKEKASINSFPDICSRSFFGDQPSRHRKLMNASGKNRSEEHTSELQSRENL